MEYHRSQNRSDAIWVGILATLATMGAIWCPACGLQVDHDPSVQGPYVIAEDQSTGLTWITVGGSVVHKCESHDWLEALHEQHLASPRWEPDPPQCGAAVHRDGGPARCARPVTWRGISVDARGQYQWAWACDLHRGALRHAMRLPPGP